MGGRRGDRRPRRRAESRGASSGGEVSGAGPRGGGNGGGSEGLDPVGTLSDHTRLLWGLAVGLYGVGDLLTTAVGVYSGRAVEAGPVAAGLVDLYGPGVVFPLKLGSLLAFYLLWRAVPDPYAVGVPLGLAGTGALLTVWNVLVLLGGGPSSP